MFDLLKNSLKKFVETAKSILPAKKEEKENKNNEEQEKESKEKDEKNNLLKETRVKVEKPKAELGITKSITTSITGKVRIDEKDIKNALEDLEIALIEADTAIEATDEIIKNIKEKLINSEVKKNELENYIINTIKETLKESIKTYEKSIFDLIQESNKKPYVILFFGPNGAGKTSTIAKIAYMLKDKYKVLIVAADTFRAAAIEQLEEHAKRLNVDIIKGQYNQSPSAVVYNALSKSKDYDVILIDTAGRQEINLNLMKELEKLKRVAKGNLHIFIAESTVGSSIYNQIKEFHEIVGINAVILTKADLDSKGGAVLSISKSTGVPIMYITTGQEYNAIKKFDKDEFINKLLEW
jgi:fused signal recognition particle receptor